MNRADRTMEVEAIDIVEETPALASTYPMVLDAPVALREAAASPDDTAITTLASRRRQSLLRRVVVGCLGACGVLLVLAAFRAPAHAHAPEVAARRAPSAGLPAATPPAEASRGAAVPWSEVATRAPVEPASGTVEIPQGKAVAVDGKRMSGLAAVVPCGKHQLRVGRATTRAVVVPCGGTLRVEPNGSLSVY